MATEKPDLSASPDSQSWWNGEADSIQPPLLLLAGVEDGSTSEPHICRSID